MKVLKAALVATGLTVAVAGSLLMTGLDLLGYKGPLVGACIVGVALITLVITFLTSRWFKRREISSGPRRAISAVLLILSIGVPVGAYWFSPAAARKLFSDRRTVELILGPTDPSVESIDLDGAGTLVMVPPYDGQRVGLGIKVIPGMMRNDPNKKRTEQIVGVTDSHVFSLTASDHVFNVGLRTFHVLLEDIAETKSTPDTHYRVKYTFRINEL